MKQEFYQIHIELTGLQPSVFREFIVPNTISLDRLHDVIQIVMGWEDAHLHMFSIEGQTYTENPESPEDGAEEGDVILGSVVRKPGMKFTYTYDFGDDWLHTLTVKKILPKLPVEFNLAISCVDGSRCCPPEDIGGPPGYEMFLDVLANKKHPEYQRFLEWMGATSDDEIDFDPEEFDPNYVDYELSKYLHWSRDRRTPYSAEA